MSQSNRGARWLLLPSHSPTVICLWRTTECIAQWAAEKRGRSRIQWGKESPACIWSLCPGRVKYFFVWGLSKGKPPEASWSLLCQKSDRKEESTAAERSCGDEKGTRGRNQSKERRRGVFSSWKAPGWGWMLTNPRLCWLLLHGTAHQPLLIAAAHAAPLHSALCSHTVLGLWTH